MKFIRLIPIALFTLVCAPVFASETSRAASIVAYEECAARAFQTSDKLTDIFHQCESKMDAFVVQHDEVLQEKIRHRTKAETQRELRKRKKDKEDKDSKNDSNGG